MPNPIWARIHGGSTHFPIALVLASFLFDFLAFVWRRDPQSRDLHAAGFYALILAALGSVGAVFSGLLLTRWQTMGTGDLAKHHDFLWPAYTLVVGLAVWRLVVRDRARRPAFAAYLVLTAITAVLMSIAGYWGGEMLLGS